LKSWKPLPWSQLNRQISFRSFIETAEAASAVALKPQKQLLQSHETAEAASMVSYKPRKPTISNEYLKFLGKFKAIYETALAHESGP
jgi:hypothetical protein